MKFVTESDYQEIKALNGETAIKAGGYIESGNLCGFPLVDVAASKEFALIIRANKTKVAKATGESWAAGDRIYYDEDEEECTKTSTGNVWIGHAERAAGSAADEGVVDFDGTLKSIQDAINNIDVSEVIDGMKFTDLADTPETLTAGKYLVVGTEGDIEETDISFTDLADTPDALVADKYLVVDSEGAELELTDINFTDLADTPEAIASEQFVKGDATGEALEFSAT